MRTIVVRNVHQALTEGAYQLQTFGQETTSRNGPVKMLPVPLTTCYLRPTERVLFHPERDANPFFHLFESLWMLKGRRDVDFPKFFNSKFDAFSDDGEVFNAAYGYRWRNHFNTDQLARIISALDKDPTCRRQVLAMWDGHHDLGLQSKDLPCNTQAYFQVDMDGKLQMMVTNRSNDLIWGAYGANAVHFSMLLEYMALSLKREVGLYYQTSFNTHFYTETHGDLVATLADKAPQPPAQYTCPYSSGAITTTIPLMSIPRGRWDRELTMFMSMGFEIANTNKVFVDPFFAHVAIPLYRAYIAFKSKSPTRFAEAYQHVGQCAAQDWQIACSEWLQRREAKCKK
tara:strand:- start:15489 stop:16517 length:1029 start_codon:yes stop_codon:yes gene_type:complete